MKRALIVLLLVILAVIGAGCASAPQAATPSSKALATPLPATGKALRTTPEALRESTPGVTPETAPADSEADPFFFHPPDGEPGEVEIRIHKGQRVLTLIMDGEAAGRFPIGLGSAPEGDKQRQGDGRTPEGAYYVCTRTDQTKYYLSLGVSYPNTEDARRALDNGLVGQATYDRIADAEARGACPDWNTPLGGAIAIHSGGVTDWTQGCVSTADATMDILWEYCPIGTPILIYE